MSEFLELRTLSRPGSPNTFLLAPDNFAVSAKADTESPVFENDADQVFRAVVAVISSEKRWVDVRQDTKTRRAAFVAVTPFFRFKDDVDIEVLDFSGRSQIVIYSRSRVGYSDLGANAKRVSSFIERLRNALSVT